MSTIPPSPTTRRGFLAISGGVALSLATGRRAAAAAERPAVRYALIGCGARGMAFASQASAVCDPDRDRLAKAAAAAGLPERKAVTDLRRVLDDPEVDAVVIATPDHWHAPAAILACQAGKHVYVEKPVSHNLRESQLLQRAARSAGVVAQHGTQQRSSPFTREAVDRLRSGEIGEVLVAKAWNIQSRKPIGHASPSTPPASVDYDTWVGPAAWAPFQANRFHTDWHWWRNFGTGDVGNDGCHELDYARWGLGAEGLPTTVSAIGGKYRFDDDQQFPDTVTAAFEFAPAGAGGARKQLVFEMRLWSTNYPWNCDSGVEFYGTSGQMFLSKRGKLRIVDADNKVLHEARAERQSGHPHLENFFAAITDGAALRAPLDEAHKTVALIHLANASQRLGRSIRFDGATETIANDPEAQRLMARPYREGGHWGVPRDA